MVFTRKDGDFHGLKPPSRCSLSRPANARLIGHLRQCRMNMVAMPSDGVAKDAVVRGEGGIELHFLSFLSVSSLYKLG